MLHHSAQSSAYCKYYTICNHVLIVIIICSIKEVYCKSLHTIVYIAYWD